MRQTFEYATAEGALRIERESQEIRYERGPHKWWRFTDSSGHEHRYQAERVPEEFRRGGKPLYRQGSTHYATLRWVIDSRRECSGHEGLYAHEPHTVEEGHYECRQCGETVRPSFGPGSELIETGRWYYLDGQRIGAGQANEILARARAQAVAYKADQSARATARSLGYPEIFA